MCYIISYIYRYIIYRDKEQRARERNKNIRIKRQRNEDFKSLDVHFQRDIESGRQRQRHFKDIKSKRRRQKTERRHF